MLRLSVTQIWESPMTSPGWVKKWSFLVSKTEGRSLVFGQYGSPIASHSALVFFLINLRDAAQWAAPSRWDPRLTHRGLSRSSGKSPLGSIFLWSEPFPTCVLCIQAGSKTLTKTPPPPWILPTPRKASLVSPVELLAFSLPWAFPTYLTPKLWLHGLFEYVLFKKPPLVRSWEEHLVQCKPKFIRKSCGRHNGSGAWEAIWKFQQGSHGFERHTVLCLIKWGES